MTKVRMLPHGPLRPDAILGCLLTAVLLVIAACGGGDEKPTESPVSPSVTENVPTDTPEEGVVIVEPIDVSGVPELQDGILQVGSDLSAPPLAFVQTGSPEPVGLDVDIVTAIADALGVQAQFEQVTPAQFEQDLQAKHHDIVLPVAIAPPTPAASFELIPYLQAGTGLLIPTASASDIQTLCGLKVAVRSNTTQEEYLRSLRVPCGDRSIDVRSFPSDEEALRQLEMGTVDAVSSDFPATVYYAQQSNGKLHAVETAADNIPLGIMVLGEAAQLKAVLQEALKEIIDDGTYDQILAIWGVEADSIAG